METDLAKIDGSHSTSPQTFLMHAKDQTGKCDYLAKIFKIKRQPNICAQRCNNDALTHTTYIIK